MTAFSTEEHGMMRGLWGELETMNRTLTGLLEILERQEERAKGDALPASETPTLRCEDCGSHTGSARRTKCIACDRG